MIGSNATDESTRSQDDGDLKGSSERINTNIIHSWERYDFINISNVGAVIELRWWDVCRWCHTGDRGWE